MNTKAIFITVAIVAAIGMLGMAAVSISVPKAHADQGGISNINSGGPQRGAPSLQNGNQIHPAVNGNPNAQKPNYNPTESCAPISAGGAGHSNVGEPCTG